MKTFIILCTFIVLVVSCLGLTVQLIKARQASARFKNAWESELCLAAFYEKKYDKISRKWQTCAGFGVGNIFTGPFEYTVSKEADVIAGKAVWQEGPPVTRIRLKGVIDGDVRTFKEN